MRQAEWQPANYETTSVKIGAGEYVFTVAASKIAFDGFMSVYMQEEDDDKKGNVLSQSLEKGMKLKLKELKPEQHFTQPPAHYTEASLVKALEEQGIGRPSTYAPTITTIISTTLCIKGTEKSLCDRTWRSCQQYYEAGIPKYCRCQLYC